MSGNVAFTPVPPISVVGRSPSPSKTNGRVSPKGKSVERPATSKERFEEMKKIADVLLKLKDHEIDSFTPAEKKEYEDFLRELLKSWQEHRIREIVSSGKRGGKKRKNRKTRKL